MRKLNMENTLELGIIRAHGNDVAEFLQGQLSCDTLQLPECQLQLGCHCNPQGRIVFSFYLFKYEHAFWLILAKDLVEKALASLKKYALFSKTELNDVTSDFNLVGKQSYLNTDYKSHKVDINNDQIVIHQPGVSNRFLVILPKGQSIETDFDHNQWLLADIEAAIPSINLATSELFTPHDLNYPVLGGVNFDKGCYIGQEVIARMQYRGKLKKHLQQAEVDTDTSITPGQSIVNQDVKEIGKVVNLGIVRPGHQHLLVCVQDEYAKPKAAFIEATEVLFLAQ